MSERFCTSCQANRQTEGGEYRRLHKTARWVCQACVERRSPSIYRNTSGRTADVAKIMRELYGRVA